MKRASDEWQSPQFHHRTVDTASNSQKKRVTEQELDKLLRLFKTSKAVILTTAMSQSKLEELFPKKEPAPSQQPSTFQKE